MNLKFFGASASALLLATALAGCTGSNGGSTTGTSSGGGDTIATVGSGSVTRAQLDQTLEGLYGEQLLPQLIDTQLLTEDLKSKNMTVSDDEVNAELTRLQDQDPSIKTAIDAGGARVDLIKNQVRRNLTVQKLLTEGITADEAKEKAFFNTYSSYYSTPTQNKVGLLAATTKVRADQLARSLQTDPNSFDKLVEEQKAKGATDPFGAQSTNDVGRFQTPEEFAAALPPQIGPTVTKLLTTAKKGQVLPVQALVPNKGPYFIIKVVDRKEAVKPDFTKLHDVIETDYKMSVAALTEIKKSPTNPQKLEDNVKQVAQLLAQPNPQTGQPGTRPSMRDILTFILRPESNNLLDKLRNAGTVQISDTAYKDVAKQYQPATSPTGGATTNSATENTATSNTAATNTAATNSAAPAKP